MGKSKIHIVTLVLIFIIGVGTSFGQKKKWQSSLYSPDSNRSMDSQDERDAIIQNVHYAEQIFGDSIAKSLQILEDNLAITIEKNYKLEEALIYYVFGKFNDQMENYSLAISNYEKAIKIYSDLGDNRQLTSLNYSNATSNRKINKRGQAKSQYQEVIDNSVSNTEYQFNSYLAIGSIYLEENNRVEADNNFYRAKRIALDDNNIEQELNADLALGKSALQFNDYEKSKNIIKGVQQKSEANNLDKVTNKAFDLLSELFESQNAEEESLEIQQQAYKFNSSKENPNERLNNTLNIATFYNNQGKAEEAIEIINDNQALFRSDGEFDQKERLFGSLVTSNTLSGNTEEANRQQIKLDELVDSLNLSKQQNTLIQASKNEFLKSSENKILLFEKERELNAKTIALLEKEQEINDAAIKRQKIITYTLLLGMLIFGIMTFFLFRSRKQKQEANQLLVLKSLRNQMNPHFIFNSLNSVNSFIAKKDERSANKYLSEFSKLMREVLEYSQEDFIPLSKEIDILQLYLNLEHFRFNSDFDFEMTIDPAISLDEFQIPPMLLQPFVENAIWHGLRYKKEKGWLKVNFKKQANHVEITIIDNGIGREKSKLSKTLNQKKMKSTGIKNVENRLEIIQNVFKTKLEIYIADLDTESKEGTVVKLKLY